MIEQIGTAAPMEVALLGAFALILGEFALIVWDLFRGRGSPTPGGEDWSRIYRWDTASGVTRTCCSC